MHRARHGRGTATRQVSGVELMPDLGRAFIVLMIIGFLLGCIITAGLPWLWGALLKPFLVWLVI